MSGTAHMSLTRKLLVLLSSLILVFCAVISFFQYRILFSRTLQSRQTQLAELAQDSASSVNAVLVQTETVLKELALAPNVRSALNETNPDRYIVKLMFYALDSINFSESLLSASGANIYLLVPEEHMPESYDLAIHLSRMQGNPTFAEFLSGPETACWSQPRQELSVCEYTYMYAHVYTYICVCIHVCVCARYICMHMARICMPTCIHTA